MSSNNVDIAGHNVKEVALIILIASIAFTFAVVAVGIVMAILANPTSITFTGSIDLSQFVAIIIGIAIVAATFVGQQLTARQVTNAMAQNDKSWIESDTTLNKT